MDSNQLRQVMRSDRMGNVFFRGVYAADQARKQTVNKIPSGYIFNTDPSNKSGTHWVGVYIDENGTAEFFCSYGQAPGTYNFETWLDQNTTSWIYNKKRFQADSSSVCGHYCLFYLLHRFRKIPLTSLQSMFSKDYDLNDTLVNNFISERFDIHTPIRDTNFLRGQIARSLQTNFKVF